MIREQIDKIHAAISVLPKRDIDKLVSFAELLKTVHEKQAENSISVDKEYIETFENLTDKAHIRIECLRTAIESLFRYFTYDITQVNDDIKQKILIDYDANRRMCGIAWDYASSADDLNRALSKVIQDMKSEGRGCAEQCQ